eukprot:14104371-Alexandrium_andersonii.AAC.1
MVRPSHCGRSPGGQSWGPAATLHDAGRLGRRSPPGCCERALGAAAGQGRAPRCPPGACGPR